MIFKRMLAVLMIAMSTVPAMALPAFADHTHVVQLGNGQCVILAGRGGEKFVRLPHADEFDENRQHPLHVKVHLGEPGTRRGKSVIFVKGSAGDIENCTSYANE